MKILYIPGRYAFCYYHRGYLPGVYSGQMVINEFVRTNGLKTDITEIQDLAKKADVVVMQRPTDVEHIELVKWLKLNDKKVIFENDDTYDVDKSLHLNQLKTQEAKDLFIQLSNNVKKILPMCDGAIASTEMLGKEYAQYNNNVAVLKNCIDPLDEYECKKNNTGKFRVGLVGSVTSNNDYEHIKDQIRQLDERGDVTIVVMGVKYPNGQYSKTMQKDHDFWSSLKNIEWHPYVPTLEYMMTVASLALDLAIIPREESYFNKCKSNLKYLEMSLLKIPVLAQAFSTGDGPYDTGCAHINLVSDNSTWYNKIVEIKDNHSKYVEQAVMAHDFVLENYNIKTYAIEWTKTIERLVSSESEKNQMTQVQN